MTIAVPRGEIIEKKAGKLNKNDNLGRHLVSWGTEKMCYKTQNVKKKNQVAPWVRVETTTQFLRLSKSQTKPHGDIPVHLNNRRQVTIEENMFTHLEQSISSCPVQVEQDTTDLSSTNQFNVRQGKIPSTP